MPKKQFELNGKNNIENALNPQYNGLAKNELVHHTIDKFSNDEMQLAPINGVLNFATNDIVKGLGWYFLFSNSSMCYRDVPF
jgi:hypothetical protein